MHYDIKIRSFNVTRVGTAGFRLPQASHDGRRGAGPRTLFPYHLDRIYSSVVLHPDHI